MWKNKETHIYDIYKNNSQDNLLNQTTPIQNYKSQHLYPGSDFDVFGKEEQDQKDQEIVEAPFSAIKIEIKETQFKTLKHHTNLIKERKVEQKLNKECCFLSKATASENTPLASMFVESTVVNKDNNVNDLAYY